MNGNNSDPDKSAPLAPALPRGDIASAGIKDLMTFRLNQQTYALPIERIVQIIEMVTITPIPQVNPSVEGVINVHGAMVPVVNLRRHLGLSPGQLQLHTPVVLVQANGRMVGLIVDQVTNVLSLTASQVTRPADVLPDGLGDAPLLQGLVPTKNGMVLFINLDRLFSLDQMGELAEALTALPSVSAPGEDREAGCPSPAASRPGAPEVTQLEGLEGPAASGPAALEATQPDALEGRA
jgi:purine-binding chemotaxis protein CheW